MRIRGSVVAVLLGLCALVGAAPAVASGGHLELTELRAPGNAVEGTDAPFTVTVTNVGTTQASQYVLVVRVSDVDPDEFGIPGTCSAGGAEGEQLAICQLPTLAPGQQITRNFHAGFKAPGSSIHAHLIDSDTGQTLDGEAQARSAEFTVHRGRADAGVTLTLPTSPVEEGEDATIIATVSNAGPQPTQGQQLVFTLRREQIADLDNFAKPGNCTQTEPEGLVVFTCPVVVAPGQSVSRSLRGEFEPGSVRVIADTRGDLRDLNPGNDHAEGTFRVRGRRADVRFAALTTGSDPVAGSPTSITPTIVNDGPDPTVDQRVDVTLQRDEIDESRVVTPRACGRQTTETTVVVTCQHGTVRPGQTSSRTFSVVFRAGTAIVEARTYGARRDPNPDNNAAGVELGVREPAADVRIGALVAPTDAREGFRSRFAVTVVNDGPDTAPDQTLTLTIGRAEADVEDMLAPVSCAKTLEPRRIVLVCPLPPMAPGASFTRFFEADFKQGEVTIPVGTSGSVVDPAPRNNTRTLRFTVEQPHE